MKTETWLKIGSVLILLALLSCDNSQYRYQTNRPYIIQTSHDSNWSTSGDVEVDSFSFIAQDHVIAYVDGRRIIIKAPLIKFGDNPNYILKQKK
jgi:hypothetical protein